MTDRQELHGADGTDGTEDRLRRVLRRATDGVQPDDRLADIRYAVSPTSARRRSWLPTVAAAAAVAVIAAGAWAVLSPIAAPPPVPAAPSVTAPVAPAATVAVALPVYYVAPPASPDGRFGLVRVFVPHPLPEAATPAQKADAALAAAVTVPAPNPNRFVSAWPVGTTAHYVALPAPEVGVSLSGPGVSGLPTDVQRLAVQALVWTVTAAVQQASAPVPVTVAGGGPIFETVGTNVFKRPADDRAVEELASLWVDSPYAGQALPAGRPVVVTGQACVFEANLAWELRQGGSVVATGHTMADSGCPRQGSWSVDLGALAAGAYEFRAIDVSAKDGSVIFQNIVPFTVG